MKRTILFLSLILSMVFISTANAQNNEMALRQYKFFDNWFVSVNGGATYSMFEGATDNSFTDFLSPTFQVGIGKWLSPSVGVRLQGDFGLNKTLNLSRTDVNHFNRLGVFGDAMFNLHNILGDYRENRKFEINWLLGLGYVHGCARADVGTTNNIAARTGLQFNYNFSKALQLNIEPTITALTDGFNANFSGVKYDSYINLAVGLTYRFKNHDGERGFKLLKVYDEDYVNSLNETINLQRSVIDQNKTIIGNQQKVFEEQVNQIIELEKCCNSKSNYANKEEIKEVVSFNIGSSDILGTQQANIFNVAKTLKENENLKVAINGFADSETGTSERNLQLSKERAETVKSILVNDYQIAEDRITVVANGSEKQAFDKNDWNRVVVFITE